MKPELVVVAVHVFKRRNLKKAIKKELYFFFFFSLILRFRPTETFFSLSLSLSSLAVQTTSDLSTQVNRFDRRIRRRRRITLARELFDEANLSCPHCCSCIFMLFVVVSVIRERKLGKKGILLKINRSGVVFRPALRVNARALNDADCCWNAQS